MCKYSSPLRFLYDKTPKRPNAQTPKRLLAVLLCLLVLYGCKRHLLETELLSPVAVISTKHIKNAKNWFDKNKPDFSSANARINIDSVRYKEFFPVWQMSKTHTLASGDTLIVVPIQRNFQIEYTEIGFLRRLCLYIQNDSVRSAKIIELISDKPTLKTNEDLIFKNAETALNGGSISNIDVAVLQYDLAYTHEKGKVFVTGKGVTDVSLSMNNASMDNARGFEGIIMMASGEIPWHDDKPGPRTFGGNSGGGGSGGWSGTCPCGTPDCPPCGTSTTPPTSSPAFACSSGYQEVLIGMPPNQVRFCALIITTMPTLPPPPTNTPPPPIPTMPIPPPTTIFIPVGGGGGGGGGSGGGGSTAPNPPPECTPSPGTMGVSDPTTTPLSPCTGVDNGTNTEPVVVITTPPRIIQDRTLNNRYNAKIKCAYNKVMAMPEIVQLLSEFKGSGITLTFKVENINQRAITVYDPITNMYNIDIIINPNMMSGHSDYSHLGIAKTIIHEILHAKMFAWIIDMGGMNGSNSEMQDPRAASSTINLLMRKYKIDSTIVADMNRVQHEYIAGYQHALLTSLVGAYDQNRSTLANYEALAWDGLEETDRYKGPLPTGLGYDDFSMDENRKDKSKIIKDSRKSENPCN